MVKIQHALALATVAALAGSALATDLSVGSFAPGLNVVKWYKGAPVTGFDSNKTFVVEFWDTWDARSRDSIPHLTELAKKNADVTFIGVTIWEHDDGTNIAKFVKDMGDKMDYHVGACSTGMGEAWVHAGLTTVPTAFVVKNDVIKWIGQPMELDEPLAQIKAGTFDEAKFKADFARKQDPQQALLDQQKAFEDCANLRFQGKNDEARTKLAAIVAKNPSMGYTADIIRLGWLATDDHEAWEREVVAMSTSGDQRKMVTVGMFALQEATPNTGSKLLGKKAIELALKGTDHKNVLVLSYAVWVYYRTKDYQLALDSVDLLFKLLPTSQEKDNVNMIQQMTEKRTELEAKLKAKT